MAFWSDLKKKESAELAEARRKQAESLDEIEKRYSKMKSDAQRNYDNERLALNAEFGATVGDAEAHKQAEAALKELSKSYEYQRQSIDDAYKADRKKASDLKSFIPKNEGKTEETRGGQEMASNLNNLIKGNSNAIGSSFDESMGFSSPMMAGDVFGLTPYLNRNLTDEQKKQVEEDRKKAAEKEAEDAKQRAGEGIDTKNLNFGKDENGNPTFTSYHPAVQAAQAMDKGEKSEKPENPLTEVTGSIPYRYGLERYLASRRYGDKDPMGRSAHLNRQAEMHEMEAGDHQRAMQANTQIANRNYRSEAERDAASKAAAENAQKVANLGNASSGAAALERGVEAADYNTYMQRSDEQRQRGVENMEKMHDDRQIAEQERAGADVYDYTARDMNDYNARSNFLSLGGPQSDKAPVTPKPKDKTVEEETVEDTVEDTEEEVPVQEEETPEQKEFEAQASHQDVLNYVLSLPDVWKNVHARYPEVGSNNDMTGIDWKVKSREKGHTLAEKQGFDVPEYHNAVEDVGKKLLNGEQVTIKGSTYGVGTDPKVKDGIDAVYQLWTGRGGALGNVEWKDKAKHDAAIDASLSEKQ